MGDFSKYSPQGGTTEGIATPHEQLCPAGSFSEDQTMDLQPDSFKELVFPLWPCILIRSLKHSSIPISQANC